MPHEDLIADQAQSSDVGHILSDIADRDTSKSSSPRQVIEAIMGDSATQFLQSLRVPDWTLLYFKLQSRIPDQAWQTLVSLTKLGRTGTKTDLPILLNKNQMKALHQMIFAVIRRAKGIRRLPDGAPCGFQVNLSAAVAWAARELRS